MSLLCGGLVGAAPEGPYVNGGVKAGHWVGVKAGHRRHCSAVGKGTRSPFPYRPGERIRDADFADIGIDNAAGVLSELLSAARLGVLQAIAVAVHLKNVDMVSQAVEQRAG